LLQAVLEGRNVTSVIDKRLNTEVRDRHAFAVAAVRKRPGIKSFNDAMNVVADESGKDVSVIRKHWSEFYDEVIGPGLRPAEPD